MTAAGSWTSRGERRASTVKAGAASPAGECTSPGPHSVTNTVKTLVEGGLWGERQNISGVQAGDQVLDEWDPEQSDYPHLTFL